MLFMFAPFDQHDRVIIVFHQQLFRFSR